MHSSAIQSVLESAGEGAEIGAVVFTTVLSSSLLPFVMAALLRPSLSPPLPSSLTSRLSLSLFLFLPSASHTTLHALRTPHQPTLEGRKGTELFCPFTTCSKQDWTAPPSAPGEDLLS